jgi:hypothetical protein
VKLNDTTRNIHIEYSVNTTFGQQRSLLITNPTGF